MTRQVPSSSDEFGLSLRQDQGAGKEPWAARCSPHALRATGQGGVYGDGGAPYFLGDSNVAVAVSDGETGGAPYFLGDSNVAVAVSDGETGHGHCHSVSWAFRNDIETARSFLDDFVSVP
jgi:hypothetical protein